MNYAEIKALATASGQRVTDLIALAPNNDPFYAGTPADWKAAEWFADLWQRFGYTTGVHIRRVHYQIVSQSPAVKMPNGTPYENTELCWNFISQASKMARYLGLVDAGAFVDRRNPEPRLFAMDWTFDPSIGINSGFLDLPEIPRLPDLPAYSINGYGAPQRYHLEIWCEKSTMNDVLLPLCSQYDANLVTGLGEMSVTAALALCNRLRRNRPCRIFYISDFDPAGQSIPVAVARKIEYFLSDGGNGMDVQLFPVALTADQVQEYRLPRTPIKESEKRAGTFEHRYGTGAVELDALEAVRPGELGELLTVELDRYYDHSLRRRTWGAERELQNKLTEIEREVVSAHADELGTIRAEYDALRAEFGERMTAISSQIERVWQAISDEMEDNAPSIYHHLPPSANMGDESDDALFDSERDYLEQLAVYRSYQGKDK